MKQPFVFIVSAFSAGIVAKGHCTFADAWIWPATLLMSFLSLFFLEKRFSTPILFVLIIFIGFLWAHVRMMESVLDVSRIPYFMRSSSVMMKGVVASDVEFRSFYQSQKTMFTLKAEEIKTKFGWRKTEGKILVNIYRPLEVAYGDQVLIEGKLHPPFIQNADDPFSYKDYLNIRGIRYLFSVKKEGLVKIVNKNRRLGLRSVSLNIRNRLKKVFDRHLTVNESGIMKAIILGDRSHVPRHVKELFLRTGTAHVLAISGLHIGAVAMIFLVVLRFLPIPSRYVYALTCLMLVSYVLLTGMRPSVMRASLMIIILLLGHIFEKEVDSLNNLALAAFLILLINPYHLFDVGFQLSFMCVGSIVIIYPRLKNLFKQKKGKFLHSFLVSLSIWFGVAGLIAYYFQIITPVSVAANLVVVPLISVVVFLGFSLMASVLFIASTSLCVAASLKVALNILVAAIFLFDQIPFTYFFIKDVTHWHLIIYYTLGIAVFLILSHIDKDPQL